MEPVVACPGRARAVAELYDALPARQAWLVMLLAHDLRRRGTTTVGELVRDHGAGEPFARNDVLRAIRAGERQGWLRVDDAHEHARLVGQPGLYNEQGAVRVDAPASACHTGAAAA